MIYKYGETIPPQDWTTPGYDAFKKLIEQGKKFDNVTFQPHCEDPEKEKLLKRIEERLARIEEALAAKERPAP